MRIRVTPTASGKHAVQVVSKRRGVLTVHKHLGSFATPQDKLRLYRSAREYIQSVSRQTSLIDVLDSLRPSEITITESKPLFLYQLLSGVYDKLGLSQYSDPLIKDLVIARIWAPVSKREIQEILIDSFNRDYALITIYRHLKKGIRLGLKDICQKALVNFAKEKLEDSLRLVFYDVTTLYFESTTRDDLRDFGFSKDHHSTTTQVVVGLVVNHQGFPLYFDIFTGRTFEGHTFLPIVQGIRKLLGNSELIVVADAAMISRANIQSLVENHIGFVVGARIANLPTQLINSVTNQLNKQDGAITTVDYQDQRLICQYSTKRAAKDKSDRLKQMLKAEAAISIPASLTNRYRFLKTNGSGVSLNSELVAKAERLEGIKGYLTNTSLPEITIIDRYHDLWRIENAFRITKSDLEARPIFHRLDETIKAHLVIVFAGLAVCRYIEIQTGMSIKKVLKIAGKVLTHEVNNIKTGEISYLETAIKDSELREKVELLRSLGY